MTAPLLRLKDNHSTMQKILQLCELADELGISLNYYSHRVQVLDQDRDPKLPPLWLEDIEDRNPMSEFPPATEFKIIYDNPKYLEEQEEALKLANSIAEKKRQVLAEELRLKEAEQERQKFLKLEKEERTLLKSLKEKYPD